MWNGAKPGVYDTWDSCNAQIRGYPGAKYKSFPTLEKAKSAYIDSYHAHIGKNQRKPNRKTFDQKGIIWDSLSVDAACSGSPGIMEYRGVWTKSGEEVFRKGPFEWGTNNVGEFLALIHGLAFLQRQGLQKMPIYSDSRTAMSWLRNKKVKTTLERRDSNVLLFALLERGEKWMMNNQWSNDVLKWETSRWGEIPADFGRK